MPLMDGIQATRAIRASGSTFAKIPIIAMTANAFDADRNDCIEAGMNDFVPKPVNPTQLYHSLLRWLAPSKINSSQKHKALPHPNLDNDTNQA